MSADRLCGLVVRVPGCTPRGPGFDYRRYQIFSAAVGLERGPVSCNRLSLGISWTSHVTGPSYRLQRAADSVRHLNALELPEETLHAAAIPSPPPSPGLLLPCGRADELSVQPIPQNLPLHNRGGRTVPQMFRGDALPLSSVNTHHAQVGCCRTTGCCDSEDDTNGDHVCHGPFIFKLPYLQPKHNISLKTK
jgi:hypothetical protein